MTRDERGRTIVTNIARDPHARLLRAKGNVSVAGGSSGSSLRVEERSPRVPVARRAPYAEHVSAASERHGLSTRLIEAVITVESAYNPKAVSRKGAQGLMQLMPDTAKELQVENPFDPAANIEAGARYLRRMLDLFGQDLSLALAAYNAGPETVRAAGGMPAIAETVEYVRRVKSLVFGGTLVNGTSSLRAERARDGRVRVTNVGSTQSSVRLFRDGRGVPTLANR